MCGGLELLSNEMVNLYIQIDIHIFMLTYKFLE
jgi:hypothetical protein